MKLEEQHAIAEMAQPMKEIELKPCPFCGGAAKAYEIPVHKHYFVGLPQLGGGGFVECMNCTACLSENSKEKVIEAWNRRSESAWISVDDKEKIAN